MFRDFLIMSRCVFGLFMLYIDLEFVFVFFVLVSFIIVMLLNWGLSDFVFVLRVLVRKEYFLIGILIFL